MGKNRNATCLGDPAHDFWKLRPESFYITGLTVTQISLECLGSIANNASLCQNLCKMWPSRHVATGSLGGLIEKAINTKLTQAVRDHAGTSPAILVLLLQRLPETGLPGIKIQTDDVDGPAFPEAGKLNPGNQDDTLRLRSRLGFGKASDRVVVSKGQVGNPPTGSALDQCRR